MPVFKPARMFTFSETEVSEVIQSHVTALSFGSSSPGVYINFHIHFLVFSPPVLEYL